jgi:hypothetical protein
MKSPSKSQSWLSDSLFNLLVDYYTEVPFRPYGSGSTRQNVVPFLRDLKPGYLCIYVKGHGGCTTWPSSLKTQHVMLAQDMPKFFRQVTRETNTKLVLYYSGLLDGLQGERHPEWRMLKLDGTPMDAFCAVFKNFVAYAICPLSPYWDECVSVHLRELITQYDPDGIWVDGDWPGPCYCPRCQKRLRADTGWKEPWSDLQRRPDFAASYARTWNRIVHDWRMRFCRYVKSLKADCVYSAGNVSARREFLAPFDWRSGDFFSPGLFMLHDMARMMRWYGTLGVPYDAYICDTSLTHGRLNVRSRSKPLERMKQEAATVASNGGAVGYWTYPLGNGAFVPSRMKKAIAVRRFVEERHEVFAGTESARWTAILVSDPSSPSFGGTNVEGAHKALAALHRSPDLMDETGVTGDFPYDLVVLPEQPFLDVATAKKLEAFVRRGGRLLTSGCSIQSAALKKLLGVKSVQPAAVKDGHVLLKSGDEPTGVDSGWDRLELDGGKELYPLYLSWDQFNAELRNLNNNWPMHGQLDEEHPEPAGFPAAVCRRVGKGMVVHICTDLFARYRVLGDPQMLRWLREIMEYMDPRPLFQTDAPSWVDVSLRHKDRRLLVHLVNHSPGRDILVLNGDDLWADEIPVIGPVQVTLRCASRPSRVYWEPSHEPLKFTFEKGVLKVRIGRLAIHGCLVVEPWTKSAAGTRK